VLLPIALLLMGCTPPPTPSPPPLATKKKRPPTIKKKEFSLRVTATAYTSRKRETDNTPTIGAWNNRLSPKRKSIAVSNDLLKMGLGNGTRVRIKGLRGIYTVRDKMHRKWRKKIDIYMGTNLRKARRWGRRKVTIYWDKGLLTSN
jgi:3D (Asp-Asp-Asp) domain-containing protein